MIPTVYTVIQHPLNKFILQPQKQLYLGKLMEKVLLLFAETTHTEPCEDLQNTKNFPQENVQKHNYMTSRDMHRPAEKAFVRW